MNDRVIEQLVFQLVQSLFVLFLQVHVPSDANCDQGEHNDDRKAAQGHVERRSHALEEVRRAEPIIPNLLFRTIAIVKFLESE